jgi:hypothetical protein
MSAKNKKRASSLTGNITTVTTITITVVITVLTKDTYPKVTELDTFSGDRKKFKAYEA